MKNRAFLLARLVAKVEVLPSGCWLWTGGKRPGRNSTYGTISVNGKTEAAHRAMLMLSAGPPPSGKPFACHSCDVQLCCNPAHLSWGSHEENVRERHDRGRQKTTMTPERWYRLGAMWDGHFTLEEMANELNAPLSTVRDALKKAKRSKWVNVPSDSDDRGLTYAYEEVPF